MDCAPDKRQLEAAAWAAESLNMDKVDLRVVSSDASFRRYFRFDTENQTLVLMDAPPDKEDSAPFIDIDRRLRSAGLKAPEILHFDLDLGFGLLEDFGDTLYRDILDQKSVDELFPPLFEALEKMASEVDVAGLPDYDALALQQEMALFPDWYLKIHRQKALSGKEQLIWNEICTKLIRSAYAQPQVFVHKDFHSCNLLRTESGEPGIIDFQDGLKGPLSYDFVSLLWDRYINWPRERLLAWMEEFYSLLNPGCDLETWIRWCDLMGLQRNLKIVGIFARLHYRDGKDGYLNLIPRFYDYLLEVSALYPDYYEFHHLLEQSECAP